MNRGIIAIELASIDETIDRLLVAKRAFVHLTGELTDEDLTLLAGASCYSSSLDFFFDKQAPSEAARALVLKFTRLLACKGDKEQSNGRLYVCWPSSRSNLNIDIYLHSYLPPTCCVVKQTRTIPAQPERVEEYESVVCTDEEGEEDNAPTN